MSKIVVDEQRLVDALEVLEWAIQQWLDAGETEKLNRGWELKNYLTLQLERNGSDVSQMGRKGGMSRSSEKLDAIRENAKKGGAPGNYYACLHLAPSRDPSDRRKAIYGCFDDKESRDNWVAEPNTSDGVREALPAIDRDLRWLQRNDPQSIVCGAAGLLAKLLEMRGEAACDDCGLIENRRSFRKFYNRDLCLHCYQSKGC